MKLKKCPSCKCYTLKDKHCNKDTKEAGYKFISFKKVSSVPLQR